MDCNRRMLFRYAVALGLVCLLSVLTFLTLKSNGPQRDASMAHKLVASLAAGNSLRAEQVFAELSEDDRIYCTFVAEQYLMHADLPAWIIASDLGLVSRSIVERAFREGATSAILSAMATSGSEDRQWGRLLLIAHGRLGDPALAEVRVRRSLWANFAMDARTVNLQIDPTIIRDLLEEQSASGDVISTYYAYRAVIRIFDLDVSVERTPDGEIRLRDEHTGDILNLAYFLGRIVKN